MTQMGVGRPGPTLQTVCCSQYRVVSLVPGAVYTGMFEKLTRYICQMGKRMRSGAMEQVFTVPPGFKILAALLTTVTGSLRSTPRASSVRVADEAEDNALSSWSVNSMLADTGLLSVGHFEEDCTYGLMQLDLIATLRELAGVDNPLS